MRRGRNSQKIWEVPTLEVLPGWFGWEGNSNSIPFHGQRSFPYPSLLQDFSMETSMGPGILEILKEKEGISWGKAQLFPPETKKNGARIPVGFSQLG